MERTQDAVKDALSARPSAVCPDAGRERREKKREKGKGNRERASPEEHPAERARRVLGGESEKAGNV